MLVGQYVMVRPRGQTQHTGGRGQTALYVCFIPLSTNKMFVPWDKHNTQVEGRQTADVRFLGAGGRKVVYKKL